jgi:ferredoxin like protein
MSNRIEEKLYQNRYMVDAGRPHIKVREHDVPSEPLKSLVTTCPAGCYSLNEQGKVEIVADGCMECGTCRVPSLRSLGIRVRKILIRRPVKTRVRGH